MSLRQLIEIDEEKCDGCGLCIPACHEGALMIVDGKARLVQENACDGLGSCLGECPQGAIRINMREAEPYAASTGTAQATHLGPLPSRLRQWPVQLALVPPFAPFLQGADLLITADCVPFAYADYHRDFLDGRAVLVGCPKLDDPSFAMQKLHAILKTARPRSVTVLVMEVPCCFGLVQAVRAAAASSGIPAQVRTVTITIDGKLKGADPFAAGSGSTPCSSVRQEG